MAWTDNVPRPVARVLPSAVTLAALCCGVSAIRAAFLGQYAYSVLFLVLAAVFDGLDGHVARLLHAASEFGAELDSLCDLVDFGVAPSLTIYAWLRQTGPVDNDIPDAAVWSACLYFVCCCAFRLARFNLTDIHAPKVLVEVVKNKVHGTTTAAPSDDDSDGNGRADGAASPPSPRAASLRQRIGRNVASKVAQTRASKRSMEIINSYVNRKKFFQGVPSPVGGSVALSPMVFSFVQETATWPIDPRLAVIGVLLVTGTLMVATLPTLSSKMLMKNPRTESHLKSRNTYSLLFKVVLVSAFVVLAVNLKWYVYLAAVVGYIFMLPVGYIIYHVCEA